MRAFRRLTRRASRGLVDLRSDAEILEDYMSVPRTKHKPDKRGSRTRTHIGRRRYRRRWLPPDLA